MSGLGSVNVPLYGHNMFGLSIWFVDGHKLFPSFGHIAVKGWTRRKPGPSTPEQAHGFCPHELVQIFLSQTGKNSPGVSPR